MTGARHALPGGGAAEVEPDLCGRLHQFWGGHGASAHDRRHRRFAPIALSSGHTKRRPRLGPSRRSVVSPEVGCLRPRCLIRFPCVSAVLRSLAQPRRASRSPPWSHAQPRAATRSLMQPRAAAQPSPAMRSLAQTRAASRSPARAPRSPTEPSGTQRSPAEPSTRSLAQPRAASRSLAQPQPPADPRNLAQPRIASRALVTLAEPHLGPRPRLCPGPRHGPRWCFGFRRRAQRRQIGCTKPQIRTESAVSVAVLLPLSVFALGSCRSCFFSLQGLPPSFAPLPLFLLPLRPRSRRGRFPPRAGQRPPMQLDADAHGHRCSAKARTNRRCGPQNGTRICQP